MTAKRRVLGAYVSGPAALWVLRRVERDIDKSMNYLRSVGRADVADALAAMYGDLHEAARQYADARDDEPTTGGGSAAIPPSDGEQGFSVMGPPQAAAALGVSERRVRQLLEAGTLAGRKVSGRWLVDEDDVARLAADRRLTA